MTTQLVTIEKLVYGGCGLARIGGRVVLAPFVLPGETARVRVDEKGFQADLEEVVTPAAGRADPSCPFYERCGGCHYQQAVYELELEQKQAILREVLRRVGKIEAPEEIRAIGGPPLEYRNRAQFHLAGGEIGYYAHGSRRLVPVDRCPISSPKINQALAALREMLPERRFPRFVRSLELFTNETEVQLNVLETGQPVAQRFFDWCAERVPGFTGGAIEYPLRQDLYRVRGRSFFQVNRFLIEQMVDCALEGAGGGTALDLYAGVGLFSLPLARRFAAVTAVESSGNAAGDLEFNAARAGLAITVRQQAVEEFLAALDQAPDFVLADPPRTGLGKAVVRELLRLRPARLVVVACDPATLARDLGALTGGGYAIERMTLIDLFPRTFHIEAVVGLSRMSGRPMEAHSA
ncbi:MAG: class I SAM-dependent RNA methyltransferase [Bryobacteraceae bacterium]